MPASQGIVESAPTQPRFRLVATHSRLGILAVGTPIDPAELDSIRHEIELRALPEGDPVWSATGPFAVVVIPFPSGFRPETDLSAPFDAMGPATSREDASRQAVRFNELQIQRGPITRWATIWTGSNGGGRLLIVPVDAPEWRPFSPFDFPPHARAVHVSNREAKRLARQINSPFVEGLLPLEWAVVVRHAAEDVHAFNETGPNPSTPAAPKRQHLEHDSALNVFHGVLHNGLPDEAVRGIAHAEYTGGPGTTGMHFAYQESWVLCHDTEDEHEFEMQIRPRTCFLRGSQPIADAAICLRNFARDLMKAADVLENAEAEQLAWLDELAARAAG